MEFEPTPQEVQSGKLYAICAYLNILILVPIFGARQNRFAMYHTNQGLVLLLGWAIASVLRHLPFVGFIGGILNLALFILTVLGVVNAASGRVAPLPILGNIVLLKWY